MLRTASVALVLALVLTSLVAAYPVSEVEPNDAPNGEINALFIGQELAGDIAPAGDVDYYRIDGSNTTWGIIALLDTGGDAATLAFLDPDGSTVRQSDSGSWEHGAGIALQNYANNANEPHFLSVRESGDDAALSDYTLRLFETVVSTQPEVEPNDTPGNATPSSYTHAGVIANAADRDCFAFQVRAGDEYLIALIADEASLDATVGLYGPADLTEIATADHTGMGGKEFVELAPASEAGVYYYCVAAAPGSATGPEGTYRVGLAHPRGIYRPDYDRSLAWLNPSPAGFARIGDEITYRAVVTNTGPIAIPGDIDVRMSHPACLTRVGAQPPPTHEDDSSVSWQGQKVGLAPGEVYSATATYHVDAACVGEIDYDLYVAYFFTGTGARAAVRAFDRDLFVPVALRAAP